MKSGIKQWLINNIATEPDDNFLLLMLKAFSIEPQVTYEIYSLILDIIKSNRFHRNCRKQAVIVMLSCRHNPESTTTDYSSLFLEWCDTAFHDNDSELIKIILNAYIEYNSN